MSDDPIAQFYSDIRQFTRLVTDTTPSNEETLRTLSVLLSNLLSSGEALPDLYSENDDGAPTVDRAHLLAVLGKRFPTFGWYSVSPPLAADGAPSNEILTGDAIDDLADIYTDLSEALRLKETCDPKAGIWYAKLMFGHWGAHAIELKRYIHQKLHEW